MVYAVERFFKNLKHECLGWSYQNFDDILKELIYGMRDKIGHPFEGRQWNYLKIFMNNPLYREFTAVCQASCHDSTMYKGIRVILDPTLRTGDSQFPYGIVRLVYEEPETKYDSYLTKVQQYCANDAEATYDLMTTVRNSCNTFFLPSAKPHIDHVKFNGPATIVFWKDGIKTVVKHDGKGRKDKRLAVLYAFIRKIYGEGKPYHNILNEIEEAIK